MRKYIPKFQPGGKSESPMKRAGFETVPAVNSSWLPTPKVETQLESVKKLQNSIAPINNSELQSEVKKQDRAITKSSGNSLGQSSSIPSTGGIVSGVSSALQSFFVDHDESKNETGYEGQQAVGNMLMKSGNPYLMVAGAAWNTLSTIAENTNGNVHKITDKNVADLGINKFGAKANNVLANIPGLGWAVKDTSDTEKSYLIDSMASAYSDSVYDINSVGNLGDSNFLFGRGKIENAILQANKNNRLLTDMSITNTQRKQSDYGADLAQQNINRYAGNTYNSNRIGKHGLKLMSVAEIKQLLDARKESQIQAFQNGGVIGVDVNVIAEGKYHAHKNHLGEISEELSDLTKKGIPVVTHSEGGEIEQVAEIEKKELIFRLEVTNKLEELFKDGSEEAMLEAGKLVAEEIIENTQDNSGEVLTDE